MSLILILTAAALVLIFLEVILPGGILGLIGAALLLGAAFVAYENYGVWAALAMLTGSCVLGVAAFFIQFKVLPKTSLGKSMFLTTTSGSGDGTDAGARQALVDATGETLSVMAPSGKVLIAGRSYDALSQSGMLERGEPVVVIGQDAFRLLVRRAEA